MLAEIAMWNAQVQFPEIDKNRIIYCTQCRPAETHRKLMNIFEENLLSPELYSLFSTLYSLLLTSLVYLIIFGTLLQQHIKCPHYLIILCKGTCKTVQFVWRKIRAISKPFTDKAFSHFRNFTKFYLLLVPITKPLIPTNCRHLYQNYRDNYST